MWISSKMDPAVDDASAQIDLSCDRRLAFRTRLFLLLAGALIASLPVTATSQNAQGASADFDSISASAISAQRQNDIPRAVELFGQAVQLNPAWPQGWFSLGMLRYGSNDFAGARDALSRYIDLVPDAGAAMAVRGLSEFETAEYPQALFDLQRGLALGAANQPRNAGILWYHEIILLNRAGRFEDALGIAANFTHGAEPSPEIVLAIGMAGLRIAALPTDAAVDASQRELATAAGNAALTLLSGDGAQAQQSFQSLFERFPTAVNTHYLYGYLLFSKDPDRAIAEFTRELEIAPSSSAAQTMLGWASLLREDYPAARKYGEQAVALNPQLTVGQLVLGRSMVETGDLTGGLDHLEKALALAPENIEIHLALVRAYSKSGRKEDAQRERLRCLVLTGAVETAVAQP